MVCLDDMNLDLDLSPQIQILCLGKLKEMDLDLGQIHLVFQEPKSVDFNSSHKPRNLGNPRSRLLRPCCDRQHCLKPPSMRSGLSLNPSCPLKPLNLSSFNIKPASTKFSVIFWINFLLLGLQKSNVSVLIVVFAFIHGTGFEIMVKF